MFFSLYCERMDLLYLATLASEGESNVLSLHHYPFLWREC